jgi:hypothetical protein
MIQIRILRSDTTLSPTIQTDALSDIDIDYPPAIHRVPKNPHPTHVQKNPTLPQKHFMAGQKFLSEQAEGDTDEQYNPPEEIDTDVQNPNLLLTSDHGYTDPFERLSWGGMYVYLNTIMKWYGVTPQINLYFDKSDLSPMMSPPRLYLGNPKNHHVMD